MSDSPGGSRDPFATDPLVRVSGARLAAALGLRGISVNQAGKHPGLKQQTVSYIVNGRTRRCRQSRRRRLAEVVGVSEAWLGGEDVPPIPDFPLGLSSPPEDLDQPRRIDENLWSFRVDSGALPPAYQLHWSHLTGQILAAWKRDIDAGVEGAVALMDVFPGDFNGEAWPRVSTLLQRALGIFWWRRGFLVPLAKPQLAPNRDELSPQEVAEIDLGNERKLKAAMISPDDADDFAKAGATAIETALRPWIEGDKALNYQAVYMALGWLRSGMPLG